MSSRQSRSRSRANTNAGYREQRRDHSLASAVSDTSTYRGPPGLDPEFWNGSRSADSLPGVFEFHARLNPPGTSLLKAPLPPNWRPPRSRTATYADVESRDHESESDVGVTETDWERGRDGVYRRIDEGGRTLECHYDQATDEWKTYLVIGHTRSGRRHAEEGRSRTAKQRGRPVKLGEDQSLHVLCCSVM
jgi:hypothetical protein